MRRFADVCVLFVMPALMAWLLGGGLALAQGSAGFPQGPVQVPSAGPSVVQPDQPVIPQDPRIERRALPAQTRPVGPSVPFVLSPQQAAQLDEALGAWEQRNKEVKSFECKFTCWKYDAVFGNGREPKTTDHGIIKYAAPDKGLFKIEGDRAEQWICDGRVIFEYNYPKKTITEHHLPPHMQGKAISDGPLPFVFGTEAQKLKQRYFLRLITPRDADGEIWIEAFPRFQRDAAEFQKAEVILKADGMLPFAIQLYMPSGKERTSYQFESVVVNRRFRFMEFDWFRPTTPMFEIWKTIVEQAPAPAQASREPVGRQ